jgi:hypothetical protein
MNKGSTFIIMAAVLGATILTGTMLSNTAYAVGFGLPAGDKRGGGCGGSPDGLSGGCGGGGPPTTSGGAGGCGGSFKNDAGIHCGGREG